MHGVARCLSCLLAGALGDTGVEVGVCGLYRGSPRRDVSLAVVVPDPQGGKLDALGRVGVSAAHVFKDSSCRTGCQQGYKDCGNDSRASIAPQSRANPALSGDLCTSL